MLGFVEAKQVQSSKEPFRDQAEITMFLGIVPSEQCTYTEAMRKFKSHGERLCE
jgi:hypothetical protein